MNLNRKIRWHMISEHREELFGIAILCVFCVHSCGFVWPQGMNIVVKLLIEGSIGVDVFLFLSAMGLYYSMKRVDNMEQFYYHRLKKVIPTYLLIAGVGFAILVFGLGEGVSLIIYLD